MPAPEARRRIRTTLAVLCPLLAAGLTLLGTTNALAATTDDAGSPAAATIDGYPPIDDVTAPAAPVDCSDAQLAERARQLGLLADERTEALQVIATVVDGSAPDKLVAVSDRARIILGRISSIDTDCAAAAPDPAPAPDPHRVLVEVKIACGDVDFTGVDPVKVELATAALDINLDVLNGRLALEFPRFADRVANEADPDVPRSEYATLARQQANTLDDRRAAILGRTAPGLDRFARTCDLVAA